MAAVNVINPTDHHPTMRFPSITGRNLLDKTIRIPEDLRSMRNLVIVAFRRYQQVQVDSWIEPLSEIENEDFKFLEVPTLGTPYRLMRPIIDGGMKGGIPDPEARERTVTVYLDKKDLKNRLSIDTEDYIRLFLLDRGGEILWREEGSHSIKKFESLKDILNIDHH